MKDSFWINRTASSLVFKLIDFPEFPINHKSQWGFQWIISEFLDHHNQRWPKNFHIKFSLSIYLLKELMMLWEFYKNITGCVGITGYWSETILTVSLQENIVFVKIFETSFDRNILAEFDARLLNLMVKALIFFCFFWVQTFECHIQSIFYINNAWILL